MRSITLLIGIIFVGTTTLFAQPGFHCPGTGSGKLVKARNGNTSRKELDAREQSLNMHKNRVTSPNAFNSFINMQTMLDSKDDSIFSADDGAKVEGYLFRIVPGNKESCNCFTADKTQYNITLFLSPSPINDSTTTAKCLAVEITPYSRQLHSEWTTQYITAHFLKKHVIVKGWLLYDYLSKPESVASNPGKPGMKRHTVWEIYPVTEMILE